MSFPFLFDVFNITEIPVTPSITIIIRNMIIGVDFLLSLLIYKVPTDIVISSNLSNMGKMCFFAVTMEVVAVAIDTRGIVVLFVFLGFQNHC